MSSRATATSRNGPHAPSSCVSVAAPGRGDSKSTTVRGLGHERGDALRAGRVPRRGRKPSNTNRSVGKPDSTSAVSTALGPGTTSTGSPAVDARAHQPLAGIGDARHAGVGHVRDELAVAHRVDDPVGALLLVVRVHGTQPTARPGTPRWVSSARVRRVSSAAITSASRSASSRAVDRSPRLPIGVATRTQRPACRSCAAQLHPVAGAQPPAVERAGLAPRSRTRPCARTATRARAAGVIDAQHDAVGVAERDVDREPHPDRVHVAARPQHQRAVERVAPEQPAPPRPRACRPTSAAASTSPSRTSQDIRRDSVTR